MLQNREALTQSVPRWIILGSFPNNTAANPMLTTLIFSLSFATPGRRQQIPRTLSLTCTPAFDAE